MATVASLSLVTSAGAETGSVSTEAPVGPNVAQVDLIDGAGVPAAAGFLPAAETPAAAEPSILSRVLLLVGLALLVAGLVVMAPTGWRRVVPTRGTERPAVLAASCRH